jgi:hypothetical protein
MRLVPFQKVFGRIEKLDGKGRRSKQDPQFRS